MNQLNKSGNNTDLNERIVKIILIGDVFSGELEFNIGFGVKSFFEKHNGLPWKFKLESLFKDADIVIGNLESPLIPSEIKVKDSFYGKPDFASFLKECGVNVVNIANNHILEHGDKGFEETLKILN